MHLCTAVSYDILDTATAAVSPCLQPTRCLAARTAMGEASTQARRDAIYEYTTRNKILKMLYLVETTNKVAETVIFQHHVPVALLLMLILLVLGALCC